MKAQVRWFDKKSGEGMIRILKESSPLYMHSIYVHYSAIDQCSGDKNFNWAILFEGQLVDVEVIADSHFIQISKVKGAQ